MGEIIDLNQPVVSDGHGLQEGDLTELAGRADAMIAEINNLALGKAILSMPIATFSTLGAGVASMLPGLQAVAADTLGTETLYRVANAAVGDTLKMAKNGNFWGAMKTADGSSKIVQLQAVGGVETAAQAVAAVNPAVLMVAVALFSVEQQLEKIAAMQKQIISFLEIEKEAEIENDLQTLGHILTQFKYSWDNEHFVRSNHKLVLDIKRTANKNLITYQKNVDDAIGESRRLVVQSRVSAALQDMLKKFQYYRMSVYIAAMASFLDVMLSGNFKEEYISGIKKEIEAASTSYRERFTLCSDFLEQLGLSSVQKKLKYGLGAAGVAAGKVISKIPLVERGSVDEYLQKAGKALQSDAGEMVDITIQRFSQVRDPETSVFADKLEDMIRIYNHTSDIIFDGEKLYLIAG